MGLPGEREPQVERTASAKALRQGRRKGASVVGVDSSGWREGDVIRSNGVTTSSVINS